jgi:hypothetical protein
MHRKNIRRIITAQLKKNLPGWKKMTGKSKKELTGEIVIEAADSHDCSRTVDIPAGELTGTEDQGPSEGIRSLPEMAACIENFHSDNLSDSDGLKKPYPEIADEELQFAVQILDDRIISSLAVPDSYSAGHREIQPCQLFRMELLKIVKYPETSYRKFCTAEYSGRERKQNRRFARLPLNTRKMTGHTELCHFRRDLRFNQLMNVLVYFLHHFYESGCPENTVIHGIDSAGLPSGTNYPLCTIKVSGRKIRICSDPGCDCGKRRNKRDKSFYVTGCRLHALTAMNPPTGHGFPLVPVVGAAGHHGSLFLKPLINPARALGIDIKLITADQACHGSDGSVLNETGVYVIAPASGQAKLPDNVLESPLRVTCNDSCEIPMTFPGATPEGHGSGCGATPGECMFESICPKSGIVDFDNGHFRPVPAFHASSQEAAGIRKNCERLFNLTKKREGTGQAGVRSQHGVVVRSALTAIVTLLTEMLGTGHKPKKKDSGQKELFAATG